MNLEQTISRAESKIKANIPTSWFRGHSGLLKRYHAMIDKVDDDGLKAVIAKAVGSVASHTKDRKLTEEVIAAYSEKPFEKGYWFREYRAEQIAAVARYCKDVHVVRDFAKMAKKYGSSSLRDSVRITHEVVSIARNLRLELVKGVIGALSQDYVIDNTMLTAFATHAESGEPVTKGLIEVYVSKKYKKTIEAIRKSVEGERDWYVHPDSFTSSVGWFVKNGSVDAANVFIDLIKDFADTEDMHPSNMNRFAGKDRDSATLSELNNLFSSAFYQRNPKLRNKVAYEIGTSDNERARLAISLFRSKQFVDLALKRPYLAESLVEGLADLYKSRKGKRFLDIFSSKGFGKIMDYVGEGASKYLVEDTGIPTLASHPTSFVYSTLFPLLNTVYDRYTKDKEGAREMTSEFATYKDLSEVAVAPAIYTIFLDSLHEGFDRHVYQQFAEFIYDDSLRRRTENLDLENSKSLAQSVQREKDFLNQQRSETVYQLARVLHELSPDYRQKVRDLDDDAKYHLAGAFDVARNNKDDEGESLLPVFYSGLREVLDTAPNEVGKWAEAVVEGLQKDADAEDISIERVAA